ncbi:UDP-4-amino-4,6-dideoxy-N-acetyl-beta-L-altrosamine transaminase [Leucobacter sp. GX24907]
MEPFIPYGRQIVDDADIAAVVEVLRSDWLTTGPAVTRFEEAFASFVGAEHAVAVSSGTGALHIAVLAAGIGPGDEVIVPPLTFVASANAVRYAGAEPVFADIDERTFLLDPAEVERLITPRTRAIVAVDYAGLPCDLDALARIAEAHGLVLIEDACHAPGAEYRGRRIGSIADFTAFSFHPVKHLTTGEGGMVTTQNEELAARLRTFRGHGIQTDFRSREALGTWEYDQSELGFNYRLSDINAALGLSQLVKQAEWLRRREEIAGRYVDALSGLDDVAVQLVPEGRVHGRHLFPVRIVGAQPAQMRQEAFTRMRAEGIGVNVHYRPVYLNSYYRDRGHEPGECPRAEAVYSGLLSLPMWPGLTEQMQDRVTESLRAAIARS